MARIAGVNLPNDKRAVIGLTYIRGVGKKRASKILTDTQIDPSKRIKDLSDQEVNALREVIEKNYTVEGELRSEIMMNIKRLREISAYRGVRHARRLPVRGQRTKTNSRTIRGNKRSTMGSGRRGPAQKT